MDRALLKETAERLESNLHEIRYAKEMDPENTFYSYLMPDFPKMRKVLVEASGGKGNASNYSRAGWCAQAIAQIFEALAEHEGQEKISLDAGDYSNMIQLANSGALEDFRIYNSDEEEPCEKYIDVEGDKYTYIQYQTEVFDIIDGLEYYLVADTTYEWVLERIDGEYDCDSESECERYATDETWSKYYLVTKEWLKKMYGFDVDE